MAAAPIILSSSREEAVRNTSPSSHPSRIANGPLGDLQILPLEMRAKVWKLVVRDDPKPVAIRLQGSRYPAILRTSRAIRDEALQYGDLRISAMTAVTSNSEIDASFGLCIPKPLTRWMKISPNIHIHNFSVRAPNTNKETDTHPVLPERLVFKQAKTIGDSKAGVSISASCGEWGYQVVVGRLPPDWTAHVYRSVTKDASTGERSVKVMPSGGEIIATCQNWSGDRGELRGRVRAFTERLTAGWHLLDKSLPIRQLAEIRIPTELLE